MIRLKRSQYKAAKPIAALFWEADRYCLERSADEWVEFDRDFQLITTGRSRPLAEDFMNAREVALSHGIRHRDPVRFWLRIVTIDALLKTETKPVFTSTESADVYWDDAVWATAKAHEAWMQMKILDAGTRTPERSIKQFTLMRDESRYRYLALSCAYSCLEAAFASMAKHIGLSGKALDALARLPFDEKWRALFDQARKPVPAATEKRVVKRMLEMRNSYVHAFVGESTSLRRRRKEHVLVSRMAPTTKEMADFLEATASLVDKYSARLESEPFNFAVGSLASLRDATED